MSQYTNVFKMYNFHMYVVNVNRYDDCDVGINDELQCMHIVINY